MDAHANLGNALKELGRLEDAVSSYRTALEIKPNYAAVLTNMGNALKDLGRLVEAEASYGDAVAANPEFAEAYYNLGIVKQHAGDLAGAAESYRAALTLNPDRAEVHNNLGIVLQDLGRMKEAETHYRAALAADPGYAPAYRHLMLIVKQADYNDDIHAMENLYARNDVSRDHKMNLAFGLGKAFDDLGEYDKAFGFFAEGNRLKRDTIDFSIDRRLGFFDALKNTFSDPFIRDRDGSGCPDTTPIFILGMPRSGTTLVEQILASHGQVHGAGELDALKAVVSTDLCRGDLAALPEAAQAAEPGVMKKLGEAYAQQLHALAPDSRFITDKMPGNFIYIGLIRLILPGAKIIHCRRDPVDTCLSVFKHHFSGDHPYAYDLRELGQYYNAYCGLMEHWDNVLPGFIHEVRYENVVRDHVAETESMLAFCGLPWDENCRNFHASDRPVRTASFEQVRQPIYKDSVQRWKAYENELAPLLEVLDL